MLHCIGSTLAVSDLWLTCSSNPIFFYGKSSTFFCFVCAGPHSSKRPVAVPRPRVAAHLVGLGSLCTALPAVQQLHPPTTSGEGFYGQHILMVCAAITSEPFALAIVALTTASHRHPCLAIPVHHAPKAGKCQQILVY